MTWVATAVIGGAVIGAGASIYAGGKAASASKSATQSTVGEQQREYDQTRADQAPYRQIGVAALGDINKLYGRTANADGSLTSGGAPDMSGFFQSPDYQFNLDQGQQAIDRSAAARGGLLSGAAVKSGQRFASGLASQQFGDFYNRLAGQAGIGQTGVQATTAAGTNAANQISGAYQQNGVNQGNSAYLTAGGINQSVQGGLSNYMLSKYLGSPPPATTGYNGNYGAVQW